MLRRQFTFERGKQVKSSEEPSPSLIVEALTEKYIHSLRNVKKERIILFVHFSWYEPSLRTKYNL